MNIFIFLQSIISGASGGGGDMDDVIENVGSVVQDVANDIVDYKDEEENYGFTSLLRANNDSIHFPEPYHPSTCYEVLS